MILIYYSWLSDSLENNFEILCLLKQSERGSVQLIQHRATGRKFILRRFTGNADVYRSLLQCDCPDLPKIYEAVSDKDQNIILEEYIQGDNMGVMLKDALFSPHETRRIVRQVCRGLWVLHSMGAVHRDIKPENIVLRGNDAILIDSNFPHQ